MYIYICMHIHSSHKESQLVREHPKGVHCSQVSFYHEEGLQVELKEERQKVLKVFRECRSCPRVSIKWK